MFLVLDHHDGIYYCPMDMFTVDHSTIREHSCSTTLTLSHLDPDTTNIQYYIPTPKAAQISSDRTPPIYCRESWLKPMSKAKQLESKTWLLHLDSPGVHQLNVLPQHVVGLPAVFKYHPFRFVDFKEQAQIQRQVAQGLAKRTTDQGR